VLDSRYLTDTDGTALQTWPDRSGNGKDATQATSTKRPLVKTGANGMNGNTVVLFDGTDDALLSTTLTVSANFYVLVVTKLTTSRMLLEHGTDINNVDGFSIWSDYNRNIMIRRSTNVYYVTGTNSPGAWIGTSNTIVSWSYGSSVKKYYKNLNEVTQVGMVDQSPTGNTTQTLHLMSRNGNQLYNAGQLGLIVVQSGDATLPYLKRINHCAAFSFKIACS
jgi:hypothetical protein